jgi:hypothetical protein
VDRGERAGEAALGLDGKNALKEVERAIGDSMDDAAISASVFKR